MGYMHPDDFLTSLRNMYNDCQDKGSVWVTLKRSSLKSKAQRNKLESSGAAVEYKCLVRATDGKKTISTSLSAKDHVKFQASYATLLRAQMLALKKRERKDKKKAAAGDKKQGELKKP